MTFAFNRSGGRKPPETLRTQAGYASRSGARTAFTFLEITVVLALLIIVAAMSWPAFEAWFQSYRLKEGVDAIRTHFVKARTLAMEEGRPYRFAWIVDGGEYRLAPHNLEYWSDLADTSASIPFAEGGTAPGLMVESVLPEGVRFAQGESSSTVGGWCGETVLFWPDGTVRIYLPDGSERPDIGIMLADLQSQANILQIRGLTGGVSVLNARRPLP